MDLCALIRINLIMFDLWSSVSTAASDINWFNGRSKYKECTWSVWWSCQNVRVDYQKRLVAWLFILC